MGTNLPTIAGFISTALFALGTLPMLTKAFRTKNMASYSLGNILLSNVGNIIYSLYVFSLPLGPIWFLHSYYLLTTALMLLWYVRYEGWPRQILPLRGARKLQFLSPSCCPAVP
ncbi:MAG: hypothetical protein RRC07_15790 [Anaerolineae bacterium]|nr:hypothetical protein [Anaerolineae bacterium]